MRTSIYVDGFNLYYRMLKGTPAHKWLNLKTLAEQVLLPANHVTKVRFFTARVSARVDAEAPRRQQIYFDALSSVPEIEIHLGNFLVSKTWAGLVPPDLNPEKPNAKPPFMPWPSVARVFKTEEKGSDVNLATHLLFDAFKGEFDVAAVITNDTDLAEPIRVVAKEMGRTVGILSPVPKPSESLVRHAAFVHHIREAHLASSQFPDELTTPKGKLVQRPESWV